MDLQQQYGIEPPGFRVPAATHPGAVTLQVADLNRSLAYYNEVVGLSTIDRTSSAATLGVPNHPLVHLEERAGSRPAPRRGVYGLYHFAILLPDRAALGRFAGHLSALELRVGMADHLVSEALYLTDPDGLGIEVYADRPRISWQHRDRELAMTTDPLDVQSVMAAGRGERWTGAPQGTTMGHVHLHVGQLDRAEEFYHRALGLDKTVWSYPGALFLSAGGYHHHLATNTWSPGPAATEDLARLLEWELIVPNEADASAVARNVLAAGYRAQKRVPGWTTSDPWGTNLRIRAEG